MHAGIPPRALLLPAPASVFRPCACACMCNALQRCTNPLCSTRQQEHKALRMCRQSSPSAPPGPWSL